jgi:hypothetical protein
MSFSPLFSRFTVVHGVKLCNAPDAFHVVVETFQCVYEQFLALKDEISEAVHPHTASGWGVYGSGVHSVWVTAQDTFTICDPDCSVRFTLWTGIFTVRRRTRASVPVFIVRLSTN